MNTHTNHARVAVLFAALTATFFTYVSQVKTLEQEAVSFQANMLERSMAMENELSEISMVADATSTVRRRVSTASRRAQARAQQVARRRQRQQMMHSAASTQQR